MSFTFDRSENWSGGGMPSKQVGHDLKRSVIANQGPRDRSSDMLDSEDPCAIAREMIIEFGAEAAGVALGRADRALDADDGEGFQVWLDIAAAIQDFSARSDD